MTVQAIQPVKQGSSGGGRAGGLLGLIAGLGATLATGGAAAPALLAGAATGSSLGQTVGNLATPSHAATQEQGVQTSQDGGPMTRRLKSGEAQAQLKQLQDSAMATAELPPQQRQQYLEPIMQAAGVLSQKRGSV